PAQHDRAAPVSDLVEREQLEGDSGGVSLEGTDGHGAEPDRPRPRRRHGEAKEVILRSGAAREPELADPGLLGQPCELRDLLRRPTPVEDDADLHGTTTPRAPAAQAPRLAEVAPNEVERAAPREDGARLVIARPLVTVEAVPRRVDVHRQRRVRRTDLRVVLLRDGLVRLAEVEEHRAARRLVRRVRNAATVVADGAGDGVDARRGEPGERAAETVAHHAHLELRRRERLHAGARRAWRGRTVAGEPLAVLCDERDGLAHGLLPGGIIPLTTRPRRAIFCPPFAHEVTRWPNVATSRRVSPDAPSSPSPRPAPRPRSTHSPSPPSCARRSPSASGNSSRSRASSARSASTASRARRSRSRS